MHAIQCPRCHDAMLTVPDPGAPGLTCLSSFHTCADQCGSVSVEYWSHEGYEHITFDVRTAPQRRTHEDHLRREGESVNEQPRTEVEPGDLESLIARVREIIAQSQYDPETLHMDIDNAIYQYIASKELMDMIMPLTFWYT